MDLYEEERQYWRAHREEANRTSPTSATQTLMPHLPNGGRPTPPIKRESVGPIELSIVNVPAGAFTKEDMAALKKKIN